MGYLYKIPYDLIPNENHYSQSFLPLKKRNFLRGGDRVAIYFENQEYAGIIALAYTASDKIVKSGDLPQKEKSKLYNPSMFQVGVNMQQRFSVPFIHRKYLFHFPSLNRKQKVRPWNDCILYWDWGLNMEIMFLYFRFPEHPLQFLATDDSNWKLKIHTLRERALPVRFYRMTAAKALKCSLCSFPNPGIGNFFELHERTEINFEKPFVEIELRNFIILCPTCHKLEHQKIRYG